LGEENIIKILNERKISWLGIVWRLDGILKDVPEGKRAGQRKDGYRNPTRISGY